MTRPSTASQVGMDAPLLVEKVVKEHVHKSIYDPYKNRARSGYGCAARQRAMPRLARWAKNTLGLATARATS